MNNSFSSRLRYAMDKNNISASELSRLSGVGKSDISNYLNNKYLAKQDKVYLLARALNVDPGWLITGVLPETKEDDNEQANNESETVRLFINGINKLTPQQIEQTMNMMKIMFSDQNLFEKGKQP